MSIEIKLGPPVWALLHSIVEKVKNDNFKDYKLQLFNLIKKICVFFPSVVSSKNSEAYFSNVNPNYINNLIDIKVFIFNYHNFINKKLKKPIFNYCELTKYDNVNIPVLQNAIVELYRKNTYMKLLPNYVNMKHTLNELNIFLFNNIYSLIKISEPIKENNNTNLEEPENAEQQQENAEEIKPNIDFKFIPCDIYKNITTIDDAFLPSIDLTLSQAMLEIIKNPKCVPFKLYVSRWEYLKSKDNIKRK
jgi:hypothetical protein